MTLTPLAPMQGPQAQQPGQLPDVPAPMQGAPAAPVQTTQVNQAPWVQDVQANFQQAHATFDPLANGLVSGAIPISPVNPMDYPTPLTVIPGDTSNGPGGGGSDWQPGPNSTPYNQGVDQGPQTDSPGPAADTNPIPVTINGASPTTVAADPFVSPGPMIGQGVPSTGMPGAPDANGNYPMPTGQPGYNSTGPDYYQGGDGGGDS